MNAFESQLSGIPSARFTKASSGVFSGPDESNTSTVYTATVETADWGSHDVYNEAMAALPKSRAFKFINRGTSGGEGRFALHFGNDGALVWIDILAVPREEGKTELLILVHTYDHQ